MSWNKPLSAKLVIVVLLVAPAGCHPEQPFYLNSNAKNDYQYYKGMATERENPDVDAERLDDVSKATAPMTLERPDTGNTWQITLEEAMQTALRNNKVMRNIGGNVQGSPEFILRNPSTVPTIYDVALAESNPRTGVEAALAAYDAQLSAGLTWQRTDAPQNVGPLVSFFEPNVSEHDIASFDAKIQKTTAAGGTFGLDFTQAYDHDRYNYQPGVLLYPADWNVKLTAEMRQPLLQGAGVQFNEIAGPGATPGVFNGVTIARIRTDIALADFEMAVRNLISDTEVAYWELYYPYRSLDAVIAGRDSALATWRKIKALADTGSKGGEAEKLYQAKEQYYVFRSSAEQALTTLYTTEAHLRYMMGLAASDGRLIRPKDEPTTAKLVFDWHEVLGEGLARSVELREEKWIVKQRELELIASKNFLLPKLDLVAQYRWLGMGNRLDGTGTLDLDNPGSAADSNAYRTLLDGEYQEWEVGFQFNMPIGFRRELAGVRNAQLALAKEQCKLQEGELELSHQLSQALREVEANYVLSQTNFNRRIAAEQQVQAVAVAYETNTITLDVLLNAQRQLAQADSDYYRAVVNYNKSISQVHYRKGSLLEYNGVYLAEGPWPGKAYFDARRRARARAASIPLDYGYTHPRVISRGPVEERSSAALFPADELEGVPTPAVKGAMNHSGPGNTEAIPTPIPEPENAPAGTMPAEPTESTSPAAPPTTTPPVKAAAPAQSRTSTANWDGLQQGNNRESSENPSAVTTDRPASEPRSQY
jgi:outer membrane protein TolC